MLKQSAANYCNAILSYGWQSIRLEVSNRLSFHSRIGKAIPKGLSKWEKGKLMWIGSIGASKDMSELMRMVRAIASMS